MRQMDPSEFNLYVDVSSLPTSCPSAWKQNKTFTQNYKMNSFLGSCAYTEDDSDVWKTDGVKVCITFFLA